MATDDLFNHFNLSKVEVLDYLIHKVKYTVAEKNQVKKE
jgi:hypothetical protein